jgi:hypothetical protein
LAVGLAFFRAVDPAEADIFRVSVVQDFESVAVNDRDGETGGSHTLKRQSASFVIETDAVSLSFVSVFTVVSVAKRLQCLSS